MLFDAAGTLIDSRFDLPTFALDTARDAGLQLLPESARVIGGLYLQRRAEHERVEATRDEAQVEAFWVDLTRSWLVAMGEDPAFVGPMRAAAHERMFGAAAETFVVFPDAAPCLERLKAEGFRLAVVSNWDRTLHQALRHNGLDGYFEFALASLQEGTEKPDPRIFQIALARLGLSTQEVIHVGDHLVDDIEGARNAGIRSVHLDRFGPIQGSIGTLSDLPGCLGLA